MKLLRLRTRWWNWVKTHSAVEDVLFRQLFWVLWLTPSFMLAIEGNRDPKFRCCGHDWMEMVCQYCRIWYLRKNWWRPYGVEHPPFTTEEGGWCLQRALCSPEGMLSVEGSKALGALHLHSPWKHQNFRMCLAVLLWSLPSSTPNLRAP